MFAMPNNSRTVEQSGW